MILPLHILIAFSSLVYTSFVYFLPSAAKLRLSYLFISLTFGSGVFLAFSSSANLVRTCLSGIVYLAIVSAITLAAQRKLATLQKPS